MKKFNQPKLLLAVLCSAIAFNAHASFWDSLWGKNTGDDGNPNTIGNAGARQAKANAGKIQVAKLKVGVVNNTNSMLASAALKDKTGKVLYISTKGKTCAAGAVCWLSVSRELVTKGNTFFFYDSKGNLVSAFMADNVPAKSPVYNIGASMDDLGVYVLSKIRTINSKITYNRVDNDIVTTSLNATPYQELADYYLDLMGNAKDNTQQEIKVIHALIAQFAKNKSIPANSDSQRLTKNQPVMVKNSQLVTKKIALKSSPSVRSAPPGENQDSPLCAESLRTAMDGLSMIPMIGDVIKVAATTARDASCPSGDADIKDYMANQFSRVNVKLGEIKTQLTGLENQLKGFEQKYNIDKLSDQQTKVYAYDNEFTIWLDQYQSALLTYRGADGKQYNTLTELINSFGSIDKAIKQNPGLKGSLDLLYDNDSEATAIANLGDPKLNLFTTKGITQLCGNANNIAGDVFAVRDTCNATSLDMYSLNLILEKQVSYVYNDINKVYAMDARQDKKALTTIFAKRFTDWANNVEQMVPSKAFVSHVESDEPVYSLVNNLQAKDKGFKVTGWYPEADKRYVEVNYTLGANVIKSKYAYQHPTRDGEMISYASNADIDINVANVMGVPVPERFFNGGGGNNYGYSPAFPWAAASMLAYVESDKMNDGWHWYDWFNTTAKFKMPANVELHAYGFGDHVASFSGSPIYSNTGYTENYTYAGGTYTRKIFTTSPDGSYLVDYYGADYFRINSGEYFTFMRYTDGANSYVWAMRTWLEKGMYSLTLHATPQCMTNDCLAIDTGATLDKVKFGNVGPRIEWKKDQPDQGNNATYTMSVIN
ncbi:MAG: hypothetical protein KBD32_06765 [Burkholderiales bacterium]|nr:hypothetical protein [Burkholderiales bacterium]